MEEKTQYIFDGGIKLGRPLFRFESETNAQAARKHEMPVSDIVSSD
ncbi:MAG: hypothetical protein WCQ65_11885 [Fermentimonas sp.]|jgi:hypothetical protein|nr:hypothetical protein [Acholeplasmataceae bacterium]MDY3202607.1 hypothetical protein [Methanocorpusculum sp.]